MLKISHHLVDLGSVVLRLEGKLVGPWVTELLRAGEEVLGDRRALLLDLAAVEFVDQQGVALLKEFLARGVTFLNCSPFVAEQLK